MKRRFGNLNYFRTFRGKLILSVALVHSLLMSLFIFDLVGREKDSLLQHQETHAVALSQSLAISAAAWLSSYDISGLQELADIQQQYPDLLFAILMDKDGKVLAHTDHTKVGMYISDLPDSSAVSSIISANGLVDVTAPSFLTDRQVGWVRIGIDRQAVNNQLNFVIWNGILYALVAILIGILIAWQLGVWFTRRLNSIQDTFRQISKGNTSVRSQLKGDDEAAEMASEFDVMLDTLEERQSEVIRNKRQFERLFNAANVPMIYISQEGYILQKNHAFSILFGYGENDFITLEEWWVITCPDTDFKNRNLEAWNKLCLNSTQTLPGVETGEFLICCKDGQIKTVQVSGSQIGEDLVISLVDISMMKATENALRKSEQSLSKAQRVGKIGSWELDHRFGRLNWSEETFRIFEADPYHFIPTLSGFLNRVHPDDRVRVKNSFTEAVKSKSRYDIEHRILLGNSNVKYIHEQCETCYSKDGEPILSIGTAQDITERKLLAIKQKESLERINKIAATVPGALFQYRLYPDGVSSFPFVSDYCQKIFDIEPEVIIKNADVVFALHHPEDRESIIQSIRHSAVQLTLWQKEFRILLPNGTIRFLFGNAVPQLESDGSVLWHGFVSDITEHRKVELALQNARMMNEKIIKTVPVRVFWKDIQLMYLGCNLSFARDAGFENPSDVIGKSDYQMGWKRMAEDYRRDDRRVIEGGVGIYDIEEKQQTSDGRTITLLTSKTPLRNVQGEIIGVLGSYMDISKLKQTEDELNKTSRLYAFISHISQMIIHTFDEDTILKEACRIAVEYGLFQMAWLGKEDAVTKQVLPVFQEGDKNGYLNSIQGISTAEVPEGKGPTGTALRENRVVYCNDIENDPMMAPWRNAALDCGFYSLVALPLRKGELPYAVFTLYAPSKDYFNIEEIGLLTDVTHELEFAIQAIENGKERKLAEKKVKDYIYALNQSSIVDVSDKDGTIQFINDNFCKITGYSPNELIGKSHSILKSGFHSKEHYTRLWETILKGKVWRGEVKNKSKDGSFHWLDTTIVPFLNENREPFQFITIRSDITQKKEAEVVSTEALERYDLLTKASSETIWDWQIKEGLIHYNQGLAHTFGYPISCINNVQSWWKQTIHPSDFGQVMSAIEEIFSKRLEWVQLTYRFLCADGSYKHVKDKAAVIYSENGSAERVIGSMADVTQELQFAAKLEKAVIEAQEKEANQIGMELHDNVNQLLAASLMYLSSGKDKAKQALNKPLGELETCEEHIKEAIQEIRRLSHQLAPVPDSELSMEEIFSILTDSFSKSGIHFYYDIQVPDNLIFNMNLRIAIYRILQEQLNNIIKYAKADEVKLSLIMKQGYLYFSIGDNGVGFDQSVKKKGIGLENIRRRTRALSGESDIKSAPGKGCILLIKIPVEQAI